MRTSTACKQLERTRRPEPRRTWIGLGALAGLALSGPAAAQVDPASDDPYASTDDEATAADDGTTTEEVATEGTATEETATEEVAAEETPAEPAETTETTPTEASPAEAIPAAQTAPAGPQPMLFHVPPSTATAGEHLEITSTVSEAWQLRSVELVYRRVDRGEWKRVPFRQVSTGDYVAVVPGEDVAAPAIEYYVESLDREDRTRPHFASPERPHRVEVIGMTSQQEENLEAERFGGRHRFAALSDWSSFGDRSVEGWVPELRRPDFTAAQREMRKEDYVQFQAEYTYRILGIVQAIHFGFGIVRGHSPQLDYEADEALRAGDNIEDLRTPGFNYGWTGITFQFHRYFGLGLEIYLGATQWGFDGGGGGYLRVGNTAGTHFDLGCDYISRLGYKAWVTFLWDTVPYVPMSLTAEFTDWPNPGDGGGDGIRLFYEAQAHVWAGLILTGRVGYAARHGSNAGGPVVGGGVAYEF